MAKSHTNFKSANHHVRTFHPLKPVSGLERQRFDPSQASLPSGLCKSWRLYKARSLTVAGTVWLLRRTPISRLTAFFEQKGEHYQPPNNITTTLIHYSIARKMPDRKCLNYKDKVFLQEKY